MNPAIPDRLETLPAPESAIPGVLDALTGRAAMVAWQSRDRPERPRFTDRHPRLARIATVTGLAAVATTVLTVGTQGARAYAMARHNVDLSAAPVDDAAQFFAGTPVEISAESPLDTPQDNQPAFLGQSADNYTDNATNRNTTWSYSPGARKIHNGEGWYNQFRQMGIGDNNRERGALLREIGPELKDRGLAYYSDTHDEWHMRLVRPDNDGGYDALRRGSQRGRIATGDLDFIMREAKEDGLVDRAPNRLDNTTSPREPDVTVVPPTTERIDTLEELAEHTLRDLGVADATLRDKIAKEVIADPELLAALRAADVIPEHNTNLVLSEFDRIGTTYVLPVEVRDDLYQAVVKHAADDNDLPWLNSYLTEQIEQATSKAANEAEQTAKEVDGWWAQTWYNFYHGRFDKDIHMFENWNWLKAIGLGGIAGLMYYDEYVMKPRYYEKKMNRPYVRPGHGWRSGWRGPYNWRSLVKPSPTPYPRPWQWRQAAPPPGGPVVPGPPPAP